MHVLVFVYWAIVVVLRHRGETGFTPPPPGDKREAGILHRLLNDSFVEVSGLALLDRNFP
jgi:hypothetical protein